MLWDVHGFGRDYNAATVLDQFQPQEYSEHSVVHLCDVKEVSHSFHISQHSIFVCRIVRRDFKV